MSRRTERVCKRILQELSKIIPVMKHPDIGFVTVTRVEISADLSIAKVYISFFPTRGHDDAGKTIAALEHSVGFLRAKLSPSLNMRLLPELRFYLDESIERGMEMDNLISEARASDIDHNSEDANENPQAPEGDADNPTEEI